MDNDTEGHAAEEHFAQLHEGYAKIRAKAELATEQLRLERDQLRAGTVSP